MMLNSLALRGRSLFTISSTTTLPTGLRPLASHAISSAHQILIIVLEEPSIRDSMVGVPLYLHTVIAFAVVFLIKMSSRWTGIGVSIDAETRTKPLIEGVIALFRSCRVGKGHILYAMADGFERLLRRNMGKGGENGTSAPGYTNLDAPAMGAERRQNGAHYPSTAAGQHADQPQGSHDYSHARQPDLYTTTPSTQSVPSILHPQQPIASPTSFTPSGAAHPNGSNSFDPYGLSPNSQPTSAGTFGGWQTEDDMLWSMGMGYDLLATAPDVNAHGLGAFVGWPGGGIESASAGGPGNTGFTGSQGL